MQLLMVHGQQLWPESSCTHAELPPFTVVILGTSYRGALVYSHHESASETEHATRHIVKFSTRADTTCW